MKKGLLAFVILLLLSAFMLNSLANKANIQSSNGSSSVISDKDSSEVNPEEKEVDFTEGVWIKKYPGDYACFKLETPDGYKIICDPFSLKQTIHPDVVTESHQHIDHADTGNLDTPFKLLKDPGEYTSDHVKIHGLAGQHNKNDPMGTNIIFVFDINDITIAHFASQGEVPDEDTLKQIGRVDILLIQVFNNPDYNKLLPEDIDPIINQLKPKIIIPEHAGPEEGSLLAKHLNIEVENEYSGNIVFTRKILDETEGIRIIDLYNDY